MVLILKCYGYHLFNCKKVLGLLNSFLQLIMILLVVISFQKQGFAQIISSGLSIGKGYQIEKIFICLGFSDKSDHFPQYLKQYLRMKNAVWKGDCWIIKADNRPIKYEIKIIKDMEGVKKALMTQDAHILLKGHANFGLGPVFSLKKDLIALESQTKVLEKIKNIDDERILPISSQWIAVPIERLRKNNGLKHWWPRYRNGALGIAPYGLQQDKFIKLPYNYYLTYQIPGNSRCYRLLDDKNMPIERFPFSGIKPWYSPMNEEPDSSSPDHQDYFIGVQDNHYSNICCQPVGHWQVLDSSSGYYGENYLVSKPGTGKKKVQWDFSVRDHGHYTIFVWQPPLEEKMDKIKYILKRTMEPNQLNGEFSFPIVEESFRYDKDKASNWQRVARTRLEPGRYQLITEPVDDEGGMVADAIRIVHDDNPKSMFIPFFFTATRQVQTGDLLTFFSKSLGAVQTYFWDFGDGNQVQNRKNYVYHRYKRPGKYDVSLGICGYNAGKIIQKTKKAYIHVGQNSKDFQPDFTAFPNNGALPLKVKFTDRSLGKPLSRQWDFGDGQTSSVPSPEHVYERSGNYSVTLTVTDSKGVKKRHIKKGYICVSVFDTIVDNLVYPQPHYDSYTLVKGDGRNAKEHKYRFKRLFFDSCNVERYFLDALNRGKVFYTTKVSNGEGFFLYLDLYLKGSTDIQIMEELNRRYPSSYAFFDFDKGCRLTSLYGCNKRPSTNKRN